MTSVDQLAARGQEALREAILLEMTGSGEAKALLKEHYDNLQDLTNISKKTLKRFFKEKAQVGPQTRNLLAAIALGKKEELVHSNNAAQDYYLAFLETLNLDFNESFEEEKLSGSLWEFGKTLAQHYASFTDVAEFIPVNCKRKRTGSGSESSRELRQEIELNTKLLSHHYRVLITGEPGMGKTLFAKHLCYEWANHQSPDTDIPIYIDLKSPDYHRHAHGINSFLLNRYFRSDLDWMVLDFLERNTESYYLLLDGFDDLATKQKDGLIASINNYSPNIRYIILGRSYAFQDFNYPTRSLYEICGFDLRAQQAFVEKFEPGFKENIKLPSLMTFIHGQPILSGLARSPMHLSQMVRLTATTRSLKSLENINSGLELQQVYNLQFSK